MSYGMAKAHFEERARSSARGQIEVVIAPRDLRAHAAGRALCCRCLTLGIPGSPPAAVLLGGC
jgi:putative tricarboxylic transport membrane protein